MNEYSFWFYIYIFYSIIHTLSHRQFFMILWLYVLFKDRCTLLIPKAKFGKQVITKIIYPYYCLHHLTDDWWITVDITETCSYHQGLKGLIIFTLPACLHGACSSPSSYQLILWEFLSAATKTQATIQKLQLIPEQFFSMMWSEAWLVS